jgi:FkbM family methyltransferase
VDTLIRLVGKLPSSWLLRTTQLRRAQETRPGFRYPKVEPLLEWCLERGFRCRDSVIQRGAGKGLRFNCGHGSVSFVFGTHEPDLQRVFELLAQPGMTFYDVGANVGFYCVIVASLTGPGGRVVAFEPLADNARWIEHNAALNGFAHVEARREALGNDDGEARFFISADTQLGKLTSAGAPPPHPAGKVNVKLRRMDSLVAEGAIPTPNLIKIDVEGGEVEVLSGARHTLRRYRPTLIIDLHGTNASVAAILEELEYRPKVLGSARGIVDSAWDACVIAAPAERDDLGPALHELATSSAPH